ncbi:ribulose-phosphate 3-epimerase [Demequina muriae]|uniref:Ribulose-phosphate 3-epimerase n=1 Tax=Demequina muriae TaxID=3051664 RepID=A0ABT8GJU1_9MICO|nr:ribulose-phosphate 3-epimerase [Demequina sp. EGI L300058]MDN4481703.1 ribulose-phosphate 3-epimerase [Demequina sp. EGI L300058]
MGMQISPSILAADFANLERDITRVANADWLHVDVMDAHFVPNLTLGLPVLERIAEVSPMPIDAHLMIDDPDHWAPRYAEAGATSVTFHFEAAANPVAIARDLRALGARASVALKPGTDVDVVLEHLKEFDMVLVMTVEPGFGGQSFMPEMLPKFTTLRAAATAADHPLWLQADGGVSRDTIEDIAAAGCDVFVAGSAVFGAEDPAAEVTALRDLATHARNA